MNEALIQASVFVFVTLFIGALTWWLCRKPPVKTGDGGRDYFLAGGGLSWIYIAGSITLTNLSTDQLVGMNGNQMLLLAWWELAAVCGLIILAYVFLPLYYKYKCTTTTELLEHKLGGGFLRMLIATLFLLGGLFIYLPIMLYTGSLLLQTMFAVPIPLIWIAAGLAAIGAAYAVFGGLRAVAVSDTISGVGVLGMALLVVILALQAINFDLSGIPPERLSMIGGNDSPIPWHTLFTGMIFIQIFYWSFNQTITQRAMAAPSLAEARRGVLAAAGVRLLIVPLIVVVPGVVAYALFGDVNDRAYGMVVAEVLPPWLSGVFAAMMAAAVLTSFNSALNSGAALYVLDLHPKLFGARFSVQAVATIITMAFTALAVCLVPLYAQADSIINLVQQLNGLLSMPILSAFFVAIFFRNVSPIAVAISVITGTIGYGVSSSAFPEVHYIHQMAVTLIACVALSLTLNAVVFRRKASFSLADWRNTDESPTTAAAQGEKA
jgi:SSS family solute:Na+ symporter